MTTGAYTEASSRSNGGGTFRSRPRGRFLIGAGIMLVVVIVCVVLLVSGGGSSNSVSASNAKYGSYPTYLKNHTTLPSVNDVLSASMAHPQLKMIEGNTAKATLSGEVQAEITAVGPTFPTWVSNAVQAGTLSEGSAVPAKFMVTVIANHGSVPLSGKAFSILTSGGQLVHPAVTLAGGKPIPATLAAGQHVNLTISTKLVEGDGSVRWAPSGSKVIVGWLYQLELD